MQLCPFGERLSVIHKKYFEFFSLIMKQLVEQPNTRLISGQSFYGKASREHPFF